MMTKYIETPLTERFASKFEIVSLQDTDDRVRGIRKEAFKYFKDKGFPSIKNEEWRFTNMVKYLKDDYELEVVDEKLSPGTQASIMEDVKAHLSRVSNRDEDAVGDLYRMVMVNGKFYPELSKLPDEKKLRISSFKEAAGNPLFIKNFAKIIRRDGFSALNTAFFKDGLMLTVPDNQIIEEPVYLVNIYRSDVALWLNPRHLIVLGRNAEFNLIETILKEDEEKPVFVNNVTEIALDTQAHFNHYDIQIGNANLRVVNRTRANQRKHSCYNNYTFTFPGADVVRNTLNLYMDEEQVEAHLYGLYFTAGQQLVDNHTEIHHQRPNCLSNQLYKGVLFDRSKAVFNGKIYVYEDAQQTNAFQQSNNILLSDKATVNAKPQLEIFADDVKASHGTTVGQLDKEAIFYLKCRGIGEQSARNMMINAFAFDVSRKVKNEALRIYLEKMIHQKMEEVNKA